MGTKFKINFIVKEQTILSKFIDYKLNPLNVLDSDEITIEKLSNEIPITFKKITKTKIDLPKPILDLVGFNNLEIEEIITLTHEKYSSILHSPESVKNKISFTETFTCYQEGEFITCILIIEGINYLPVGLKQMAENIYSNKRKNRLIRELQIISGINKNNKKFISNCSIIQ